MGVETVACYGEACVDYLLTGVTELPAWGTSTPISALSRYPGGNAVNCSIAISKLGQANALPVVKIGKDLAGDFIRQALLEGGISPAALDASIVVDPTMQTPAVVVLVQQDKAADRAFLHSNPYPTKRHAGFGSPKVEEMRELRRSMNGVRFHHFAGVGSFDALTRPEVVRLIKEIRKATPDSVITADTVPVRSLRDESTRLSMKAFLDSVDYFMPSDFEAAMLTDNPDSSDYEESAARLRERFKCKNLIIKIHERGAYLVTEDGTTTVVHPYPLADPVDSTGAGDAWCAGFLSGLTDGRTALDACELGNAAAHYCIQEVGATTNIPSFTSIAEVVRDHQSSRLPIFISHADADTARQFAQVVAAEGATPLLDVTHIHGGELVPAVASMIEQSKAVIVLVSPAALASNWVPWEIEQARRLKRAVYPVITSMPTDADINRNVFWSGLRRSHHWAAADALEPTGLRRLLSAIRRDLQ